MIFVGKTRYGIVRLMFEKRTRYPAGFLCFEHGQAAAVKEIVYKGGNENGFTGPGQPGYA